MNGMPDFFGNGPISPDEMQLVSLIGFILVSLVYTCGSAKKNPQKILQVMLESGGEHPQLRKAVAFVRDALRKDPSNAYATWFMERAEFGDLRKRWKATKSR